MASVYRAVRSGPMGFAKQVAIKRLHPSLTEDDAILKALINEARLGGQLKHPNIVEIYEFNKAGDTYYLAMEFVDGWTLERVIRLARKFDKPIPPEVAIDAVAQLCDALNYAHTLESLDGVEVHLVHRDLKPANIILSREGAAKLMDFGIAKADTNLFKTTAVDTTKGTPHYMSPEQVAGDPNLGTTSDLFALGSVLYELATGKVLFRGDSLASILFAVARAEVDAQVAEVDDWIPGLSAIVGRCLKKDPAERFASARELGKELVALRESLTGPWTIRNYLYTLRSSLLELEPAPQGAITVGQLEFAALLGDETGSLKRQKAEVERARQAADAAIDEMLPLGNTVPVDVSLDAYAPTLAIDTAAVEDRKEPRDSPPEQEGLDEPSQHSAFDSGAITSVQVDAPPDAVTDHEPRGDHDDVGLAPKPLSTRLLISMLGLAFLAILVVAGQRLADDRTDSTQPENVSTTSADAGRPDAQPTGVSPPAGAPPSEAEVSLGEAKAEAPSASVPKKQAAPKAQKLATRRPQPTRKPAERVAIVQPPAPAPVAPAPAPVGTGTLKVKRSTPYSRVFINGTYRGDAPLPGLELPTGSHEVRLDCPGLGTSVRREVQIATDSTVVVPAYNFHDGNWSP